MLYPPISPYRHLTGEHLDAIPWKYHIQSMNDERLNIKLISFSQ